MDANQAFFARTDVIIGTAAPDNSVSREIARGILLSKQVVMVPDPPLELLRTNGTLIAVVTCVPGSENPPEAIPVASITRLRLRSTDISSSCVMLRLVRSTQCMPTGPRHSIPKLVEALRSHRGSLWEVMSSPGGIFPAGRERVAMTAGMNDGEGPWDYEMNSPEEYLIGICNVCHCCHRGRLE